MYSLHEMLSSLPFTTQVCDVSCGDADDTESNANMKNTHSQTWLCLSQHICHS